MPEHIQRALQLLSSGDLHAAELLTEQFAAQVKAHHQTKKPGLMLAEGDLARLYTLLGRFDEALSALRRAIEVPSQNDPERQEAKLKYSTNLAELLSHTGDLEEATRLHHELLAQRARRYGRGSLGYAVGEAPFAELLLYQGQLAEAELHAKSAVEALLQHRAKQAAHAVALYASVRAARYGDERPLLESYRFFEGAPQRSELLDACLERARRDPPMLTLLVLDELRERLEDADQRLELLAIIEVQRLAASASGDHRRWATLLRERLEGTSEQGQRLEVLLLLSVASGAANDLAAARRWLEEAERIAEGLGAAARVRVLRNKGRLLMRHHLQEEAKVAFDDAISAAEGAEKESLGGALVARALFLFHSQQEAGEVFSQGLGLLSPTSQEARLAAEHVSAMASGRACSCALTEGTLRRARSRLPLGLLRGLWIESLQTRELRAEFEHPPTPRERATLARCFREALEALPNT